MSAPTPAPGDESPREGYYPDPSIPGYVRYWNGASWVPGTSRPAPPGGTASAPAPAPTADAAPRPPAQVDETGPMYLDEVEGAAPAGGDGGADADAAPGRPLPASAWQADTSRQSGFGGERDHRVSWGGPDPRTPGADGTDPRTPGAGTPGPRTPGAGTPEAATPHSTPPTAATPTDGESAGPRRPGTPDPTRGPVPGMRDGGDAVSEGTVTLRADRPGRSAGTGTGSRPPTDGTVTIRAVGPGTAARPSRPRDDAQAEGTMTIRAVPPGGTPRPPAPAPSPTPPQAAAPGLNAPLTQGPDGGSASWPQQAHQFARPEQTARPQQPAPQPLSPMPAQGVGPDQQQPVVPWKPPVDDPFQQLVRSQASVRPAALGKRLAARILDTVVLGVLAGAAGFPLVTRAMDHIDRKIEAAKMSGETVTVWLLDSTTAGLFGGVLAAFLVLGCVLEAVPTAKWGRTLGKKLCGLEVRDIESHDAPGLGAALRRWLVYGVLGLVAVGVLNVLWCLIDRPWRQCWHDKAARTFVAGR
ncbi:RDD family protein [Streptomyces sp. HB132]|uniref:RDD family protein n=1 Tax=Streptomyces sp. HB132 TaxID=767388 RepID=UPI001960758C|nr:RDD family protein [Streptomyces sp. HB132]MBM7438827.1 putative RDD family membrane protein YckC [Streptomyces sp. HB132]